jgi:SRSO17 transposase
VGAARQYSGTLGKVGNCQVTVNCHYAERTIAWPVATRLYLPKEWTDDPERLKRAKVPKEITFQTKPQIALGLLDQADQWGVPYACVVADADYGDNPNFLAGLENRHKRYVAAVRKDFQVALTSHGPAQPAEAVLAALSPRRWQTIRWREGRKGWLKARFTALRCWRVTSEGTRRPGWLIGERPARGEQGKRKYHWSNFSAAAALEEMVEYAHRRFGVEQFHEESKGLLGWDQYQGRLWTGFHRNSVLVMLAYSFLVKQEWQQRQQVSRRGRPRRPFSPSARPPARVAAGGASAHL